MPIVFKGDIINKLKEAGYNTYIIRKENLLSQSTLYALRHNKSITLDNLNIICKMLNCQPGDIIERIDNVEKTD